MEPHGVGPEASRADPVDEHAVINTRLDEMEHETAAHAARLQRIEIELGIFRPPVHQVADEAAGAGATG